VGGGFALGDERPSAGDGDHPTVFEPEGVRVHAATGGGPADFADDVGVVADRDLDELGGGLGSQESGRERRDDETGAEWHGPS